MSMWLDKNFKQLRCKEQFEYELKMESIDEEIIEFLKEFNSYNFVASLYSCSGHRDKKDKTGNLIFITDYYHYKPIMTFLNEMKQTNELQRLNIDCCNSHGMDRKIRICISWEYEARKYVMKKILDFLKEENLKEECVDFDWLANQVLLKEIFSKLERQEEQLISIEKTLYKIVAGGEGDDVFRSGDIVRMIKAYVDNNNNIEKGELGRIVLADEWEEKEEFIIDFGGFPRFYCGGCSEIEPKEYLEKVGLKGSSIEK